MAPKRILLPIDITHAHPEYFAQLNELMPLEGSQVHLLYVREELPSAENLLRTLGGKDELDKKVEAKAKTVMDEVQATLTGMGATVTQEITGGPTAVMIEKVARDEKFDFIAIPPGSKKSADKYLLGRVSSKVVRRAPATVLLLRGKQNAKLSQVLIGIDGSDESMHAVKAAVESFSLAERGAKITLVNVVSVHPLFTMVSPVEYMTSVEGNLKMSGETVLADGDKLLSELGIKGVEMKQLEGNAADCLMELQAKMNADLIVVGAQGKGVIEHFMMGSTSERLADQAQCPVAIFKGTNGQAQS